jgi:lipoprotein-releasing system permease protein
MLALRIAARFLRTSPVQSIFIVAGIAVGLAVLIFVASLITSLQQDLLLSVVGTSPHVTVAAIDEGDPIRYSEQLQSLISSDERVEEGAVVAVRETSALYTSDDNSAPLNLKGGVLEELDAIYDLDGRIVDGEFRLGPDDVMVGLGFSEEYGVDPGDDVILVLPGNRDTRLTVSAIIDFGQGTANDRLGYVDSELPRSVLGQSADEYSAIEVQLDEAFDSVEVQTEWEQQTTGVTVTEWQAENGDLLSGLRAQSSSSILIQVFVMVAVALGIAATLAISAVQKTQQIGILKALGMRDRQTGLIFLWEGAILGVFGTLAGMALGYGLVSIFLFVPVPFTITVQPDKYIIAAVVGIMVALVSAIIPYRKTARLDPIEVIQGG